MQWKEWLVPSESEPYVRGDIRKYHGASIKQILTNSKIISLELSPASSPCVSQSFNIQIQQPLPQNDGRFQFSSLNIFFDKPQHILQAKDSAIQPHFQMDYMLGSGPEITENMSIKGFDGDDQRRLESLLGEPIMGLWFYRDTNLIVLCFDNIEEHAVWSLVFEAIETDQGALALKWAYVC